MATVAEKGESTKLENAINIKKLQQNPNYTKLSHDSHTAKLVAKYEFCWKQLECKDYVTST